MCNATLTCRHFNTRRTLSTAILISLATAATPLIAAPQTNAATQAAKPSAASTPAASTNRRLTLKTVVVVARRRPESEERVPIAVTVLTQDELNSRGILNISGLQSVVPSLTIGANAGQNRSVQTFNLRGQGTTYTGSPSVVVYTDGVPDIAGLTSSIQGGPGKFLDLQSVQVLRGPQGTLFGRNTTAGAVLLQPAMPTGQASGYAELGMGTYGSQFAEAVSNLPISPQLKVRIAGRYENDGGFTKDTQGADNYDNNRYGKVRIGVLWTPAENLTNYTLASWAGGRTNGSGYILQTVNTGLINAIFAPAGGCAGVGLGVGCSTLSTIAGDGAIRHTSLGAATVNTRVKDWKLIDHLTYRLSPTVSFDNIISYSRLRAVQPYDADGTPFNLFNVLTAGPTVNAHQVTEEARIAGAALDDALHYTAGLYYEKVNQPPLNVYTFIFFNKGGQWEQYDTSSRAFYMQGTYNFGSLYPSLSGLDATVGFRHTRDRESGGGALYAVNQETNAITGCTNGTPILRPQSPRDCAPQLSTASSANTWTAALDYNFSDHAMIYGSVSKGYKAGGLNFTSTVLSDSSFKPAFVTSYEAGVKGAYASDSATATWDLDIFDSKNKDLQRIGNVLNTDVDPPVIGTAIFNAASATIKGAEFHGHVTLRGGIAFDVSFSHLIGTYGKYQIFSPTGQLGCDGSTEVGLVDLTCMPMANTPMNQFSVAASYQLPVPVSVGYMKMGVLYTHTSSRYTDTGQLPVVQPGGWIGSYGLVNLTYDWDNMFGSGFSLEGFVTNATNNIYRVANTDIFTSLGIQSSLYGPPRVFGIRVKYAW